METIRPYLKLVGASEPRGIEALIFDVADAGSNVEARDLLDLASYGGSNFAAAVLSFRDNPSISAWKNLLTAGLAYQAVCQLRTPKHEFDRQAATAGKAHAGGPLAARSVAKGAAEDHARAAELRVVGSSPTV